MKTKIDKLRRALVYGFITITILLGIAGLGFMTNIYPLFYSYGEGHTEYFTLAQPLNHAVFDAAIVMIVMAFIMLVFDLNKKRPAILATIYTIIVTIYSITSMMVLFRALPHYKAKYLALDLTEIKDYTPSTFEFDISLVFAIASFVIIILLALVVIYQFVGVMKERKANGNLTGGKIRGGVVSHE